MSRPSFYNDYRERVLAKTDGSNIHKVNGLLGIILNGSPCVDFRTDSGEYDKAIEGIQRIQEAMRQIKIETGVSL